MRPIRLGIIGCGVISRLHARTALSLPDVQLAAVADVRPESARDLAAEFKVPRWYASADELLADADVDAVVLAMPTGPRARLGLAAFAAGKHLLTEKPVAMNAAEVRQLLDAQGRLVGACCSCRFRSLPSARAVTEFLAADSLGALRQIRCRAVSAAGPVPERTPPPWRLSRALNGGGILVNWGSYDLDYLLGITGWRLVPRRVWAHTWAIAPHLGGRAAPGSDAETHVVATVEFTSGAVLTYDRGEFFAGKTEHAWQIIGEQGSLRLMMTGTDRKSLRHEGTSAARGVRSRTLWSGDEPAGAEHAGPVTDFVAAIREGRPPLTGLRESLVLATITDAVYASARTGRPVEVEGLTGRT